MAAATDPSHERSDIGLLEGYSDEERPLESYAAFTALFATAITGTALAARAQGRELPERPASADVVMIGLATHKLSRLIAKGKITSFMRAPFTELQDAAGQGELEEKPRGSGIRRSLGELLVCPFCLGQWLSAGFAAGLVFSPRATRLVAGSYSALTLSDFVQLAYVAACKRA
jgi:hypothetical protein